MHATAGYMPIITMPYHYHHLPPPFHLTIHCIIRHHTCFISPPHLAHHHTFSSCHTHHHTFSPHPTPIHSSPHSSPHHVKPYASLFLCSSQSRHSWGITSLTWLIKVWHMSSGFAIASTLPPADFCAFLFTRLLLLPLPGASQEDRWKSITWR